MQCNCDTSSGIFHSRPLWRNGRRIRLLTERFVVRIHSGAILLWIFPMLFILGVCSEPARSLLGVCSLCSEHARSVLGVCSEFARSLLEAYSLSYLSSKNMLDNIGYISVVATTLHVDDKQNVLWTLIKIETKFEIIWLKQNNKFINVLLLSLWKS